MVIAITGGIASGKSTVANIIRQLGGKVLSADNINKEMLNNQEYIRSIEQVFPQAVQDNCINKGILKNIILKDNDARLTLNAIAHPLIKAKILEKIYNINSRNVFVEVPLLVESDMSNIFDSVWVVISYERLRVLRAIDRDNTEEAEVKKFIEAQASDEQRLAVANEIIVNDSSIDELYAQVKKLYCKYND